jgi:hypothetical protein
MNKIEFALKLAKDCTYADEMTEGAKEHLRNEIDEALKQVKNNIVLPDVSGRSEQLIAFCDWYKTTDFNCEGHSSNDCVNEYLKSN